MNTNSFKSNEVFSWIALTLVIAGDIFAVLGRRGDWSYWKYWVLGDILLLIVLGIVAWNSGTKFKYRAMILTKLLANATGNKTLNILYLLAFAFNFACLGNAILPLFQKDIELDEAFYPLLVCAFVLMGLIIFFPNGREEKATNAKYVFISGISFISKFNREQKYDSFSLNLVPLVRMFQIFEEGLKDSIEKGLTGYYRKCEFLIVLSDAFTTDSIPTLRNVMHVVCPSKEEVISEGIDVEENLRHVIREVIKKEFPLPKGEWIKTILQNPENPEEEWTKIIDNIEIDFTEAINYNKDFDTAYNRIEEKVNPKDDENHELYFNLTPGTSIIGGILSLFAIDGDRKLYIYSQAKPSEKESDDPAILDRYKRDLLKPMIKSRIPLKNLLSQALESELEK